MDSTQPAHYNLVSLGNLLVSLKDRVPHHEKSDVHRLQCNDCHCVYIGKTSRTLIKCVFEHVNAWTSRSSGVPAYADHLIESQHKKASIKMHQFAI